MPRQLVSALAGDPPDLAVARIGTLGLAAVDDRSLLDRIEGCCEVFVTVDKRLPSQQRLAGRPFGTVLLRASANTPAALRPLVQRAREAAARIEPGELVVIAT
ncbi:MAG: hypothetical protein MUE41_17360 [Gemmatimonadaceae bacterium]|nr:hypothetical protein [Gemmatimonadaceae bacterium]